MNTHDLAHLLLSSPAVALTDKGGNEKYAVRYDLKGLKLPGIASIGGWVYPEANAQPAAQPARVAQPVKPQTRAKRLNPQVAAAPVAVAAAPVAKAAPAPAVDPNAALKAQMAALIAEQVGAALKAAGIGK